MEKPGPKRHFTELDSLRGLAALTVLFGHYSNPFRNPQGPFAGVGVVIERLKHSALFGLFAGHQAVMLFFVLSGFVLSLQFLKGRKVEYGPFVVKRYFRIYAPYLATLAAAVLANLLFFNGPIADLDSWFNEPWAAPVSGRAIADHLLFLHDFPNYQFNPVLWSLVQELRISLAFPLLMFFVLRMEWKRCLALGLGMSVAGLAATIGWIRFTGHEVDYFLTLHYAGVFILGFLLARHLDAIQAGFRGLPAAGRIGVAVLGYGLYCFSHLLPSKLLYFADIPTAVGAALMVIAALCSVRTSAFLHLAPVRFLGRISYSLYLLHCVVMLSLVHLLYGKLPIGLIMLLSTAVSVLLGHLSYEWIELPAIRAGKAVSGRLEKARDARKAIPGAVTGA